MQPWEAIFDQGSPLTVVLTSPHVPWHGHPRFVLYHHLLGLFPRSPLHWGGPSPTIAAHRDPSEILSGLEAPLNQPVWAADA